jgi:hypothetical protein
MKAVLDEDRVTAGLGELARRQATLPVDPDLHRAGRARFLAQALHKPSRAAPRWRAAWWAAPAMALAVAAWFLWPRALRYEVKGSELDGPYVSAPPSLPVDVTFSEGTSLHLDPDAKLRIEEVRSSGARVLIERGKTAVHVVHRARTAWTFVAGPFEVRVVGTRFDLNWDSSAQTIDLLLQEGALEVTSPFGHSPIAMRAGQRFLGDLLRRSTTVVDAAQAVQGPALLSPPDLADKIAAAPAQETADPSGDRPTDPFAPGDGRVDAVPGEPIGRPGGARSSRAIASRRSSWPKLVASGQFAALVSDAEARGIAVCLAGCSSTDLRALADAARYTGRSELAEQCLYTLRRRFARSESSAAAAFLLGRTFEASGAPGTAETWYDTYLAETPSGELAAEALAGKMRAAEKLRGRGASAAIAREYLRRYPTGVHAGVARRLLAQ